MLKRRNLVAFAAISFCLMLLAAAPLARSATADNTPAVAHAGPSPSIASHGHPRRGRPAQSVSAQVETSHAVRTALLLTILALIPALAICVTPFVRIIVVLSMIRHGLGMPETPPNQVLVSLAIFLSVFVMMPTLSAINSQAFQPFMGGTMSVGDALQTGSGPLRQFMLKQVHDDDIKAVYQMAREPLPARAADVDMFKLIPAFMLNELRVSFKMGFVIFLPFLLIDIVVSSILLSLGMLMVPPSTISLPIKVLMFVLVNGWTLVLQGVVGSIR